MYRLYNLLLLILILVLSPVILVLMILKPKFRAGFWQKIGIYNIKLPKKKTILIHAVSVGEINAVESFVKRAYEEFPEYNIVISTVTRTGQQVANARLYNWSDKILYFPFDFWVSVKAFIRFLKPSVVLVAETEIWPNFVNQLKKKNIPIMIINGRISPNSYKGYKKFKFFFENILSKYTKILMQTEGDKCRITDVGAPEEITKVMGNLKFDIKNNLTSDDIQNLKNELQILDENRVLIAGSTHQGEDEIVLENFKKLKEKHSDIKLIIAPRHPERYSEVTELLNETGYKYGFRSKNEGFKENDIIMLDTMGELGKIYSVCHLAFIGGSFSSTGGHNPLEATVYNVPTISGSCVFNFKDIYKLLTDENASVLVETSEELFEKTDSMLSDAQVYGLYSNSCKDVFSKNSGAVQFALDELKDILSE